MEPLVAVTVTLKVPSGEEMVNIDVAEVVVEDSVTLGGLSVAIPLPDGTVVARFTVPEYPLDPASVIAEVPEDPELIVKDVGLADTAKLGEGTLTGTLTERENVDELLAVTVMA